MWYFLVGTFPWLAVCLCPVRHLCYLSRNSTLPIAKCKGVFEKGKYSSYWQLNLIKCTFVVKMMIVWFSIKIVGCLHDGHGGKKQ